MRRRVLVLALSSSIVAATMVATLVAAWVLLPDWAKSRLAGVGLGDVDFVIDTVSPGRLSVSDIRFGRNQEQRLERLTVLFRPTELLRSQTVDSILIEGADLHFVSQEIGIPRLAGVSLFDGSAAKGNLGMPAIPARAFELRTSRVRLQRGIGALRIPVTGTLTQPESRAWTLDTQTVPNYGGAHADLALKAHLEKDGTAKVQAALSGFEGWLPGWPKSLGEGNLNLEWDRAGRFSGKGRFELYLDESRVVLDLQANREKTAGSALSFALDMNASDLDMAALDSLTGLGTGIHGRASLQVQLEGALPIHTEPQWQETTANGRVSLQIADAGLAGLAADTSVRVDADLSLSDTWLSVVPIVPWELTGRLVDPGSPASFGLSNTDGQSLVFTLSTDLASRTAAGAVDFLLKHPSWSTISGTAVGRIKSTPTEALRFDLDRLQIDPTTWILNGLEIVPRELNAQLTGTASRMDGLVSAKLDVSGAFSGDNRITGGEASLRGRLIYEDGSLTFKAEDCLLIKAERLNLGGIRSLRPIELCAVQPDGKPLFRIDPSGTSRLELTLPSHPVALAIGRGKNPFKLAGTTPTASLAAMLDSATGRHEVNLVTQGGRLELTEQAVAISDIELSLAQGKSTSIALKRAVVRSLLSPPDFPVLALAGKADGHLDEAMTFELVVQGRRVPLNLSAKGEHNFALAIGKMSYELDKIRFSSNRTQPGDIFPAIGKLIRKARGSLALRGGLSWVAGVPAGHSRLMLSNLGFDAPGLRVRGVETRLERAGPTVRNKLTAQEIRVDLLDIGIPLRKGLIRFHTRKAPSIHIEKVQFAWGGGVLQTKPFDLRVDKLSAEHSVVLELDEIQLSTLLELAKIQGLQGTGTLSGRVPLRIHGSEVMVDQGLISAKKPGVLRYRPEDKPAFFEQSDQTALLFKALQDFRYDSLAIRLNGRTRDDLQLSISLAGANPDLYDGHPFKLNFNISGEIDTILQRSLSIATFAERFGEAMSRYLH